MYKFHLKIIIKECTIFLLIYLFTMAISYVFKFHFKSQPEAFFRINLLVVGIISLIYSIRLCIYFSDEVIELIPAFLVICLFSIGIILLASLIVSFLLKIDFYLTYEILAILPCFTSLIFINKDETFWFTEDQIKNKFNKINKRKE